MKVKTKKYAVNYINTLIGIEILRPLRDQRRRVNLSGCRTEGEALTAIISGQWEDVRRQMEPDELASLVKIKNIFEKLAEKLLECEDVSQVIAVADFVDGINTGRVSIVEEI